jgi:hypothetical protein
MKNTLTPADQGKATTYQSLLSVVSAMLLDRQQGRLGTELLRIVPAKPT